MDFTIPSVGLPSLPEMKTLQIWNFHVKLDFRNQSATSPPPPLQKQKLCKFGTFMSSWTLVGICVGLCLTVRHCERIITTCHCFLRFYLGTRHCLLSQLLGTHLHSYTHILLWCWCTFSYLRICRDHYTHPCLKVRHSSLSYLISKKCPSTEESTEGLKFYVI